MLSILIFGKEDLMFTNEEKVFLNYYLKYLRTLIGIKQEAYIDNCDQS